MVDYMINGCPYRIHTNSHQYCSLWSCLVCWLNCGKYLEPYIQHSNAFIIVTVCFVIFRMYGTYSHRPSFRHDMFTTKFGNQFKKVSLSPLYFKNSLPTQSSLGALLFFRVFIFHLPFVRFLIIVSLYNILITNVI